MDTVTNKSSKQPKQINLKGSTPTRKTSLVPVQSRGEGIKTDFQRRHLMLALEKNHVSSAIVCAASAFQQSSCAWVLETLSALKSAVVLLHGTKSDHLRGGSEHHPGCGYDRPTHLDTLPRGRTADRLLPRAVLGSSTQDTAPPSLGRGKETCSS